MERCPDKQVLQTLLESEAASDAQLQGHLEACADCRHTLEMLAGDPVTWEGAAGLSQTFRNEPALQELMERLKAEQTPLNDQEIQAMLGSSDQPGVIGTLGDYD